MSAHDARDAPLHALAQRYFDALYHCDVSELAALLHPHAVYAGDPAGQITVLPRDAYLARLAQRRAPAASGEPRDEQVLRVEWLGQTLALLHVTCAFGDQRYRDVLGLVCERGRWCIASKLFHAEPRHWPTT